MGHALNNLRLNAILNSFLLLATAVVAYSSNWLRYYDSDGISTQVIEFGFLHATTNTSTNIFDLDIKDFIDIGCPGLSSKLSQE